MEKLTANMEDYLKTIYLLQPSESAAIIHISDIAASMNISKASVCRATDVLTEKGLLTKDKDPYATFYISLPSLICLADLQSFYRYCIDSMPLLCYNNCRSMALTDDYWL